MSSIRDGVNETIPTLNEPRLVEPIAAELKTNVVTVRDSDVTVPTPELKVGRKTHKM